MLLVIDGFIGNKATSSALGSIGSAIYTYLGAKTTVKEIVPSMYDYICPHEDKEADVAKKLVAFALRGG